jgi:hypothetical protein
MGQTGVDPVIFLYKSYKSIYATHVMFSGMKNVILLHYLSLGIKIYCGLGPLLLSPAYRGACKKTSGQWTPAVQINNAI